MDSPWIYSTIGGQWSRRTSGLLFESNKISSVLLALNDTFLTLIPKEEKVTNPNKFIPISLCNIIYKIRTKVISSCLKLLMHFLISHENYGYVEDHRIIDSIILSHEV
jgi:hypothetical protein